MKFLCVPCDEPMKLDKTEGPDDGSMTLVFACQACGYEMAMLTNPFETQVVGSLGVKLGPDGQQVSPGESKCPFTGMVQEMSAGDSAVAETVPWTAQARERLQAIPSFVRPMAKSGIEKYARDKGYDEVDEQVLAEARTHFGM